MNYAPATPLDIAYYKLDNQPAERIEMLWQQYLEEIAVRRDIARMRGNIYRKLSLQLALGYDTTRYQQFDCDVSEEEKELLFGSKVKESL